VVVGSTPGLSVKAVVIGYTSELGLQELGPLMNTSLRTLVVRTWRRQDQGDTERSVEGTGVQHRRSARGRTLSRNQILPPKEASVIKINLAMGQFSRF
jgi:hypothetical protein